MPHYLALFNRMEEKKVSFQDHVPPNTIRHNGVTVSFANGSAITNIVDGALMANAETANCNPNLTIDLGARKRIDAL